MTGIGPVTSTAAARRRLAAALLALGLALALLVAGPTRAEEPKLDWLVLRDGTKVAAREGWEVRGKTVVLKTPDGKLVSIPLEEVDLDKTFGEYTVPPALRAAVVLIDVPPPPPPDETLPELIPEEGATEATNLVEYAAANRVSNPGYSLVSPLRTGAPSWVVEMMAQGAREEELRRERDRREAEQTAEPDDQDPDRR